MSHSSLWFSLHPPSTGRWSRLLQDDGLWNDGLWNSTVDTRCSGTSTWRRWVDTTYDRCGCGNMTEQPDLRKKSCEAFQVTWGFRQCSVTPFFISLFVLIVNPAHPSLPPAGRSCFQTTKMGVPCTTLYDYDEYAADVLFSPPWHSQRLRLSRSTFRRPLARWTGTARGRGEERERCGGGRGGAAGEEGLVETESGGRKARGAG